MSNNTGAIRIFDAVSGKNAGPFQAHTGYVPVMAFSADGMRLATGSLDTTAVIWDVAKLTESFPRAEKATPSVKQLEESWNRLAHTDGRTLWPAMDRLVAAPEQTVALLREKLKPEPAPDLSQVDRWVSELGNPRFAVRDKATRSLAALGGRIGPTLVGALQAGPSPEAKRRLEGLLQTIRDGISITQLRPLRSIEVLERINTPAARQVLETYANQTGEDDLKREAETALKRMAK
jgi:WD40 repeat protein